MTRLVTCGYETGDANEAGVSVIGANCAITAVATTPTPRAGAYCLKIGVTSGSTFAVTTKTFSFAASKTEVWLRSALYMHPAALSSEMPVAQLSDSLGAAQSSLTWEPATGLLRLRLGNTSGSVLGVSSMVMAADTWNVIEWRWKVLTATTGNAELWLNGNQVINFSGDVAQTSTLNVQSLAFGSLTSQLGATGVYMAFDDIAVNDISGTLNNGRAGDGRVVLLLPNGAGSSTQWVRGGTDTGANYSQVNEIPPSMAQYVGSPTVGNRDLYALQDLAVAVQSINVVEAIMLAQNSDAGGGSIAPTIKSGATTNESGSIGLSTSSGYVTGRWETDPNTGAAWTAAAVNAAEAGATVR